MDSSPPGSSVHGILQARILECVAMPSSRGSSQPRFPTLHFVVFCGFFTSWATHVKNLPAVLEMGSIPGSENPLEEGMATHSSILAWRIPWTEEPVRIQSTGSQSQMPLNVYLLRFQLLNLPSPCYVFKVQHKDSMVETSIYLCMQNNQIFFLSIGGTI